MLVESEAGDVAGQAKESSEDGPEEEPPSVPSSPSGVNRRTSVLFTKKAGALFKVREHKKERTCSSFLYLSDFLTIK